MLDNRNNRGTQTARRTEVISYVVQVAGTWTLPAQRFHWWDTQSQALKAVELGAITFTVVAREGETSDGQSAFIPSPKALLLTLLALIVAGISVFLLRKLPKPPYPWFRAAWDRLHRALSVALALGNSLVGAPSRLLLRDLTCLVADRLWLSTWSCNL